MKGFSIYPLLAAQLLLTVAASQAVTPAAPSAEAVTCYTNTSFSLNGNETTPLVDQLALPGDITVFTNGTLQVKDGKLRNLKEGQILRADGFLVNPDGSTEPVCDHVVMQNAKVWVVKDGEAQALSAPLTLPDGTVIQPDGSYVRPDGRRSRLVDGQLLTLQGVPIYGLDTITLRNGKTIVYKAGAVIALNSPNQLMGMYDGSRVSAQGLVTFPNGSTLQLAEGQTIAVPSLRPGF